MRLRSNVSTALRPVASAALPLGWMMYRDPETRT
jgi:hypothetical protein